MFVDYIFAKPGGLPPMPEGLLYQYVVGANGVFVRAWRPGMAAMIPVGNFLNLRGLAEVYPYFHLEQAVPLSITARMFERAYFTGYRECLFYLSGGARSRGERWALNIPEQEQSASSVRPVDPGAGGSETMIEVHSHHQMSAFFSRQDDIEEQTGFRVYAVIGGLARRRPQMRARVGIYGHFWEIPAGMVFRLPEGLIETIEEES